MIKAIVLFFLLTSEVFAMNAMSELAVKLRDHGYPQAIVRGDNVYLVKTDDYLRYEGQEIHDEYVKVPQLANLLNNMEEINYSLHHEYLGPDKELWIISDRDVAIKDENVWIAVSKYWLLRKGTR